MEISGSKSCLISFLSTEPDGPTLSNYVSSLLSLFASTRFRAGIAVLLSFISTRLRNSRQNYSPSRVLVAGFRFVYSFSLLGFSYKKNGVQPRSSSFFTGVLLRCRGAHTNTTAKQIRRTPRALNPISPRRIKTSSLQL